VKNPMAFTVLTLIVLLCAGLACLFYGIPMLSEPDGACHYARTRSFGCSSSFGTFMSYLSAVVALALGGIWSLFGRQ
jgi:hypothetical protein